MTKPFKHRAIYPDVYTDSKEIWIEKDSFFFKKRMLDKTSLIAETILRQEHDGKWYLIRFISTHDVPNNYGDDVVSHKLTTMDIEKLLIKRLNRDVYTFSILGQVNPSNKDSFGNSMYELDQDQSTEKERITRLIKI